MRAPVRALVRDPESGSENWVSSSVSDCVCAHSHCRVPESRTWHAGTRDGTAAERWQRCDGRVWCADHLLSVSRRPLRPPPPGPCRPPAVLTRSALSHRMRKSSRSRDSKSDEPAAGRSADQPATSSSPEQLTASDSPVCLPTRSPNRTPSSPESEAGPSTSKGMLLSEDSSEQQQVAKEKVSSEQGICRT